MITTGFLVWKRSNSVNIFLFEDSVFFLLKHFQILILRQTKPQYKYDIGHWQKHELKLCWERRGLWEEREPFLINN